MFEHVTEFWDKRDDRLSRYPLMDSPGPTIVISCCYLLFIKVIGPALMRDRKPFELRLLMIAWNLFLVAFNGLMCFNYAYYAWFNNYSWSCQNRDFSDSAETVIIIRTGYMFLISKLLELGDTVFFVLRKKDSQINFLHVFHHFLVPITTWYGATYGATGYSSLFPFLNTFVHVWMYSYYGLSAMGPSIQKYLWWKKYMTSLQMIQFVILLVYFSRLIFFPPEGCYISGFEMSLAVANCIIFLGLFVHFYFNTYAKKSPHKYHLASDAKKHKNGMEKKGA